MKSNKFLQVIILCLLVSITGAKASVSNHEAEDFVVDKGNQLLAAFDEKDLSKKYRLLDDLFLNYVDLDYIAKFVIGKYWHDMTAEQKAEYIKLFKRYALAIYKGLPLSFDNRIDFKVTNIYKDNAFSNVVTDISLTSENGIMHVEVSFRLDKKDGLIKIIDLKLAESSLILSYRNRFYQMVKNADEDISWFLEDFKTIVESTEKTNTQKLIDEGY